MWTHEPSSIPITPEEMRLVGLTDAIIHYFQSLWPKYNLPPSRDASPRDLLAKLSKWLLHTGAPSSVEPFLYPSERRINNVLSMAQDWRRGNKLFGYNVVARGSALSLSLSSIPIHRPRRGGGRGGFVSTHRSG